MSLLVIQSCNPATSPEWLKVCTASIRGWTKDCGYDYHFEDDACFERLPRWYQDKFAGRGAQLSDLARLLMARDFLSRGYEHVLWCDADLLIFMPSALQLPAVTDSLFGRENWVSTDSEGRLRTWKSVHNAFMVFSSTSVVLPYLIYSILSVASRIDPERMAPQTLGPKLLSGLHNLTQFELIESVGALSPEVLRDVQRGEGQALSRLLERQACPLVAANLCASLADDAKLMEGVVATLVQQQSLTCT